MNELIFQSEETKEYLFAYEVHFRFSSECYLSHEQRSKGDMVIVHCERGYNIGFIDRELQYHEFYNLCNRYPKAKKILAGLPIDDKKIREMLTTKVNAENHALEECRTHCQGRRIGALADIVGAEFQFDRKKLTIFIKLYENVSVCRLVRKLYDTFKMRVKVLEVNSIEAVEKLTKKYLQLSKLNISESLIFSSPPPRPTSIPSNSSENDDLDDKEQEKEKEQEHGKGKEQEKDKVKESQKLQQEQSNQQQKIDTEMKNLLNKQKQQQQQQQQKQIHQLQRQHQVLQTAATVAANMNANMNQQQKKIKQPHFTNNYQYLQDSNQYQSQYLQQYHQQQINNHYNNSNQHHHHHHQQQQHGNNSILSHFVHNYSNNNNHYQQQQQHNHQHNNNHHHYYHHQQQPQHGDYNDSRYSKNQNNFMGYNHHQQQPQPQQSRSYHPQQHYQQHHHQQQQQLPMSRKPIQQYDMSSYLQNYHQVEHQQKYDSNYPSTSSSPSIPSSILTSSYYSVTSPITLSGASSPSHYSSSHSDMESLYDDIPVNTLPLSLLPNENYLSELNYNHQDEGSFSSFNLRQPKVIASALSEVTTSTTSPTTTTRNRSTISMGLEVPLPVHHSENCYDLDLDLNYLNINERNQNSFLFPNRETNLFEDLPVYSFTQSIIDDNNNVNNIDDSDSIESLVASLTLPSDNYTNASISTTPTISTSSSPITCMFDNHFSLLPVESLSGVVVPSRSNNFNNIHNNNNNNNSTNESVQTQQETKSPNSSCYILQSA